MEHLTCQNNGTGALIEVRFNSIICSFFISTRRWGAWTGRVWCGRAGIGWGLNTHGSGRLSVCIQKQLVSAMQAIDNGYQDRGVKERKNLCVLRETYMPAALVELGFIDSEDVRLLKEHQEDMARAVARGVTDYWQESLEGIKN